MARVVRKVSNKAVHGQKKQKRWYTSKLFWIIVSSIIVIGVALGIVFGVVLKDSEEEVTNEVDYFLECEDVEFVKASYSGIKNYVDPGYKNPQSGESLHVEHAFIFVYDLTTFFPDEADEENYDEDHKKLLDQLVLLQKSIDSAKEKGLNVELYIVDSYSGDNADMLTDTKFGGSASEDSSISYMFSYIKDGELFDEEIKIGNGSSSLCTTDMNTMITNTINRVIGYVEAGLEEAQ